MALLLVETGDHLLTEASDRIALNGPVESYTLLVNGADRSEHFDLSSLNVVDQLNEQPNSLSVDVFGFTPAIDQSIVVGFVYETDGGKTLFAGTITSVRRLRWRADQGRIVYAVQAVDATRVLDASLVTTAYGSQSASTIVADLIDTYTTGITRANLESGLASVETEFKMQRVSDALTQVANLVGAFWYLDEDSDLHFFVAAETDDIPADVTSTNTDVREFTYEQDVSQVRNRILVEGKGTSSLLDAAVGSTSIPVEDSSFFDSAGGELISGNQQLTYAGTVAGGGTSTTDGLQLTVGGSLMTFGYGTGTLNGNYEYVYTVYSDVGESNVIGPATASPSTQNVQVAIPGLVVGSVTITGIKLYRSQVGLSDWQYVGQALGSGPVTINDNLPDANRGEPPPVVSGLGASALSTSLRVVSLSPFTTSGWIDVGGQPLKYTGKSAGDSAFTGIPASGPGAMKAAVPTQTAVVQIGAVTGVPASGTGALVSALIPGDELNVLITRNDTTSQASYGIREYFVQDRRLSINGAEDRGDAELTTRKDPLIRGTFRAFDWRYRSGKPLTINHWGLSFDATIMRVSIRVIDGNPQPERTVEYANLIDRQSLYAILRRLERERGT